MAKYSLIDISKKMRKLDICMMTTMGPNGHLTSRPMSNNGDVEYDGNSYFFTYNKSEVVKELGENSNINLSFQGPDMLYISITGKGDLIENKEVLKEHWVKSLNRWFEDGVETPGIIMIHVKADHIKFWQKEEEGEVKC
jgi:general stress protein 26